MTLFFLLLCYKHSKKNLAMTQEMNNRNIFLTIASPTSRGAFNGHIYLIGEFVGVKSIENDHHVSIRAL